MNGLVKSLNAQAGEAIETTPVAVIVPGRHLGWWAGKGLWAVLDQGFFASSNFVLGILLARWLSPEQFGSFAVAHSAVLLAGAFHASLVTEPMLVFGSGRHSSRFLGYLDILLQAHWRVTGPATILLASIGLITWVVGSVNLATAFLGAAVATPLILFGWLVRRACLSRLQPQWAAAGGALYLVLLLTGSHVLWQGGVLSAFWALVLLGAAGFISGLWILERLRRENASTEAPAPSTAEVFHDHWCYARWTVASNVLSWIPGNIYFLLLPGFAGIESAGTLKAASNLVMPVLHFNGALATLLLPALASRAQHPHHFNRLVVAGLAAFTGGSVLYWIVVTALRHPIIHWLYGGAFVETASIVPIIALVPLAAACSVVLGSALRALERPRDVFWAQAVSTAACLTVGVWATAVWGLAGAAAGIVGSSAVTAAVCGAFLLRFARRA